MFSYFVILSSFIPLSLMVSLELASFAQVTALGHMPVRPVPAYAAATPQGPGRASCRVTNGRVTNGRVTNGRVTILDWSRRPCRRARQVAAPQAHPRPVAHAVHRVSILHRPIRDP